MNQVTDLSPDLAGAQSPADRGLLHQTTVDRLRDLIVQGELAPGVRLNERLLCERLGISRTPLREALKVLSTEGLVALQPNRGAVVTAFTPETVREIFEVMEALESLAGELACRNATDAQIAEIRALHYQMLAHHARADLPAYFRENQKIHLAIIAASGNATLTATYRGLNAHVRRARYMANLTRDRWDQAVAEHGEIVDALVQRDAARLSRLLHDHLAHKMTVVLAAITTPNAVEEGTRRGTDN